MPKSEFTKDQVEAIGQLVCDLWGSNFQTRLGNIDGAVILYAQSSPNTPVRRFEVDKAGSVLEDNRVTRG